MTDPVASSLPTGPASSSSPVPPSSPLPQMNSLSPRTPWPASGVVLRLGVSLALLALTLPLLYRAASSSEAGQALRTQVSAAIQDGTIQQENGAPVRGRFSSSGPAGAALHVTVRSDLSEIDLSGQMDPANAAGLQAVFSSSQARDALRATQNGGNVELEVRPAQRLLNLGSLKLGGGTLKLKVNPAAPLSLNLNSSGKLRLDLSRTALRDLTVKQDLGEARVTFPNQGTYRADLRLDLGAADVTFPAGAYTAGLKVRSDLGSITVHVPRGARVRLQTTTDLGTVRRPDGYSASGTGGGNTGGGVSGSGPDLTLDLTTDAGSISVLEDAQ